MALIDFFDRGRSLNGKAAAYVMDGESWTFDEVYGFTCQLAHALRSLALPDEAKAAVLSANHPVSWMCVLGIWRAGLAWVPANPRSSASDLLQQIQSFDVEVLFFQRAFLPIVEQLRAQCPQLRHLVCIDDSAPGCTSLNQWIADQPKDAPAQVCGQDALAAILPTGGTTGVSKGVMLTHRNLSVAIAYWIITTHYDSGKRIVNLAAAPMTHTAGVLSLPTTARGGTVVVLSKPDPIVLLDAIEAHGVTEFFLPPTVIYRLLEIPGVRERDFSTLRYFMYGAAPMSVEKLKQALEVFGPVMMQGYGQTEAPGGIASLRPEDHFIDGKVAPDERLSACGLPSVLNSLAITDESGKVLPAGASGEICVRGDIVMRGYYKQPEATAQTIVDGWLHSGDMGHIDAQGYLHITDRKRDVIITGGFNVYPIEVEQVLWSHPAVMECAVVGIPDERWGEAVKAVVELKPYSKVSAEELIELCKTRLGSVKTPKSVDFVDALPRSPVGKVLKRVIRDTYWNDRQRRI